MVRALGRSSLSRLPDAGSARRTPPLLQLGDDARQGRRAQQPLGTEDEIAQRDPFPPQFGQKDFERDPYQLTRAMRRVLPEQFPDGIELPPQGEQVERRDGLGPGGGWGSSGVPGLGKWGIRHQYNHWSINTSQSSGGIGNIVK